MQLEVLIQKCDNRYELVINPEKDYNIDFGLFGEGKTVREAIKDFYISQDEMEEQYNDEQKIFPKKINYRFVYDLASFLEYYSKILTLAGLERLTGIAQGQLSHYLNGHRKPSKKTMKKLQTKLHQFGSDLSQVTFI